MFGVQLENQQAVYLSRPNDMPREFVEIGGACSANGSRHPIYNGIGRELQGPLFFDCVRPFSFGAPTSQVENGAKNQCGISIIQIDEVGRWVEQVCRGNNAALINLVEVIVQSSGRAVHAHTRMHKHAHAHAHAQTHTHTHTHTFAHTHTHKRTFFAKQLNAWVTPTSNKTETVCATT